MKKYILLLLIVSKLSGFAQQMSVPDAKKSFGFIHEGDTAVVEYEYINIGKLPLIISDYQVECGCTVLEIPATPLQPGEKGKLKVTFDSHQKYDRQERTVLVISNAINSPVELRFKGVVLKRKKGT